VILRITVKPSMELSKREYVERGWTHDVTSFNVNVGEERIVKSLTLKERALIFAQFVNPDSDNNSLPRNHSQVWLQVDDVWPIGHESVLRAWLAANI
jgi:hypothetical protein